MTADFHVTGTAVRLSLHQLTRGLDTLGMACSGVGLLYRDTLSEAFPAVEGSVSALRARFGGRQRSTLYQVPLLALKCSLSISTVHVFHQLPRSHGQDPTSPL